MLLLHGSNLYIFVLFMKKIAVLFFLGLLWTTSSMNAQYLFSGYVDEPMIEGEVYLSMVEDYRKASGIYPEQIIAKVTPDSTGYFQISGDNLPELNRIYRIHVDTCHDEDENHNQFTGNCLNSKEILFIANNKDTLSLPFSFDNEMFCEVVSNNERADTFLRIDSLKNDMQYAFGTYRSETNRQLNSEKWFKTFQEFGEDMGEPLAEVYIYSFLSDRRNDLYGYYLEDLKTNPYYEALGTRLQEAYPDTQYATQYETELRADTYIIQNEKPFSNKWLWVVLAVLFLSVILNLVLLSRIRKRKQTVLNKAPLSSQEQKVLDLILQDRTNKEIASEIYVSVSTVKTHINNIYKKLGISSRDELKTTYKS